MASALPATLPPRRAKALPVAELSAVRHIRSETRGPWGTRSRQLVAQAMAETHCLVLDVADALAVDVRAAGRAVTGEKPIDLGDLLAVANTGPGGVRLARRIVSLLRDEIDRIESVPVAAV